MGTLLTSARTHSSAALILLSLTLFLSLLLHLQWSVWAAAARRLRHLRRWLSAQQWNEFELLLLLLLFLLLLLSLWFSVVFFCIFFSSQLALSAVLEFLCRPSPCTFHLPACIDSAYSLLNTLLPLTPPPHQKLTSPKTLNAQDWAKARKTPFNHRNIFNFYVFSHLKQVIKAALGRSKLLYPSRL